MSVTEINNLISDQRCLGQLSRDQRQRSRWRQWSTRWRQWSRWRRAVRKTSNLSDYRSESTADFNGNQIKVLPTFSLELLSILHRRHRPLVGLLPTSSGTTSSGTISSGTTSSGTTSSGTTSFATTSFATTTCYIRSAATTSSATTSWYIWSAATTSSATTSCYIS